MAVNNRVDPYKLLREQNPPSMTQQYENPQQKPSERLDTQSKRHHGTVRKRLVSLCLTRGPKITSVGGPVKTDEIL